MYIGPSIFMIAHGAILKFAVTATVAVFSIQTAGVILSPVNRVKWKSCANASLAHCERY